MQKIKKELIIYIIIAIAVGFSSGILGYLVIGSGGNLPWLGQVDFKDANWDRQIVIDQPRSVVVEQDVQLKQIESDILPTLADVYFWKKNNNYLNQVYLTSEIVASGVMLTADGWMLSTDKISKNSLSQYLAFGYQSQEMPVEKIVEDEDTGIVFVKLNVSNLPVIKIGNPSDISVGQTLALIDRQSGVELTTVSKYGYNFDSIDNVILSSDKYEKRVKLDRDLENVVDGTVLTNLKGEVLGIIRSGQVVLVSQFNSIIGQVLNGQEITRPILDVNYIDLAQVDGLLSYGNKGALVVSNPVKLSPAFGKLIAGDILLKIDDVEINARNGLYDLISDYRSGDELEFLLLRDDKEITVDVVLK